MFEDKTLYIMSFRAEMISKIVIDVSNELPSMDFDHLVGIETHVANMIPKIRLDSDEVKIVGIWGTASIGKTIIARALYNPISRNFELKFYRERVWKTASNRQGLHHELLSGILDYRDMNIPDIQEVQSRLVHHRVLLILDNVSSEELHYLLNLSKCLHFGTKVILMIGDEYNSIGWSYIGINEKYKVDYPSSEEALQIFSHSAFGQSSTPRGYLEHAIVVANHIAPFPLGLKCKSIPL